MSEESDRSRLASPLGASVPAARDEGMFGSTHWSAILRAGAATTTESVAALDQLCRQYWKPLYYFARRRGYSEPDAQDLTQGFFARFLEKGLIGAANPERGRFRTFLLTALENYLTNEWERQQRQKRGGGQRMVSLDESAAAEVGYELLPPDTNTPDQLYDRRWAQAVLEAVLRRLRQEFDGRGGAGRFDVLKQFLFGDRGDLPYAEAAAQLGLSESAMKSAIYRLRQRYGELFTDEIAQTVARPEDLDEEIRHLLAALEGS